MSPFLKASSCFCILILFFCTYLRASQCEISYTSKLSQTITFPEISDKTCKDSVFSISASSSSGLPVSFAVKAGSAMINGSSITITGVGTIIIEALQPGDATFDSATTVRHSFEVTSAFYSSTDPFLISIKSSLCHGDVLNFKVSSIAGMVNRWTGPHNINSASTNLVVPNVDTSYSGTYNLKLFEAQCRLYNSDYSVVVHENPVVSISGILSEVSIKDAPFELKGFPSGGVFSIDGISANTFTPENAGLGTHVVNYKYTDANSCSGSTSIPILVIKEPEIPPIAKDLKIYELITSRPGSKHQTWRIDNIEDYTDNEVFVYNSWGILVFNKKGYENKEGWNADGMASGSYVYIVKTNEDNKIRQGTLFIDK